MEIKKSLASWVVQISFGWIWKPWFNLWMKIFFTSFFPWLIIIIRRTIISFVGCQGFRKVASGRWEFHNNMFRRGESRLLCEIQRRKAWASKPHHPCPHPCPHHPCPPSLVKTTTKESNDHQRFSSSVSSSPSSYVSLSYENKRLKRENGALCLELASTKKKCSELLNLVAFHLNSKKMVVDQRPKLFGVRLELPREKRRVHEEFSENMSALSSQSWK